jgi:hypothetical protein
VCTYEGECFSPENAVEQYFEGEWDMEYDECWETFEEREGETSEEKCYALEGCVYDSEYDDCYSEWQDWED